MTLYNSALDYFDSRFYVGNCCDLEDDDCCVYLPPVCPELSPEVEAGLNEIATTYADTVTKTIRVWEAAGLSSFEFSAGKISSAKTEVPAVTLNYELARRIASRLASNGFGVTIHYDGSTQNRICINAPYINFGRLATTARDVAQEIIEELYTSTRQGDLNARYLGDLVQAKVDKVSNQQLGKLAGRCSLRVDTWTLAWWTWQRIEQYAPILLSRKESCIWKFSCTALHVKVIEGRTSWWTRFSHWVSGWHNTDMLKQ